MLQARGAEATADALACLSRDAASPGRTMQGSFRGMASKTWGGGGAIVNVAGVVRQVQAARRARLLFKIKQREGHFEQGGDGGDGGQLDFD